MLKVGLVIPTFNAGDSFVQLLNSIEVQNIKIDQKLVIDSQSSDETVKLAKKNKFDVVQIAKRDFNHGKTRQLAVDCLNNIDIAVFLTQDVILYDANSLSNLLDPFTGEYIGAAYGRQLPHMNASSLAAHARLYNYPPVSQVKSLSDKQYLGIKTAFMSDSFAAYRLDALKKVGGFPADVIIGEDMYVAAKMLMKEYKIAYVSEACVFHSHNYTVLQEMRRYFDTGVFHSRESWIREAFGGAENEGLRLVKAQLRYLYHCDDLTAIPKSIIMNTVKLVGYRLGLLENKLPVVVKKALSGQSHFFDKRGIS